MTDHMCHLEYPQKKIRISGNCDSCLGAFKDGDTLNTSDLIPAGMCAFLYHACIPYLFTLAGKGWFKWSLDKNTVDTQCCCPGGVQVEVKRFDSVADQVVKAIVVSANPACSMNHKTGEQFILYPWSKNSCPHLFHSLFPQIISSSEINSSRETVCVSPLTRLKAITESDSTKGSEIQDVEETYDSVTVKDFNNSCVYFRKKDKSFALNQLTPKGISSESFYRVYPYFLAALYDGIHSNDVYFSKIRCAKNNSDYFWQITPKSYILKYFLNIMEFILRLIKRPQDIVDKKITFTPIVDSKDGSSLPETVERFTLNHYSNYLSDKNFCPAVFYQIYPALYANLKNAGELICPSVISKAKFKFEIK